MKVQLDESDPALRTVLDVLKGGMPSQDRMRTSHDREGPPTEIEIGHPSDGIRITSFSLDGFGPHDGPNSLKIDKGNTLLEGGNGTGKTSILYALNWCITGRTGNMDPWSEDEGSLDLINWNRGKDGSMAVSLDLEIGKRKIRVSRKIDGRSSEHMVEDMETGRLDPASLPLLPSLIPFLLYQGETSMFLSMEGPDPGKGMLQDVILTLTGGKDLRSAREIIGSVREDLLKKASSARKISERLEGRLVEIRKSKKEVDREIEKSSSRIANLSSRKESTRRTYLDLVKTFSTGSGEVGDEEKKRTIAATRAGRLEERLSTAFSTAPFVLLRTQAARALNRAMELSMEENRKRMMSGALDAQISIMEKVMSDRTCICGTPIGTSGMGRERLKHLMERLRERKRVEADWENTSIWSSDQFLQEARSDLMNHGDTGKDILRMLGSLTENRNAMTRIRRAKEEGDRSDILETVRLMERSRILLQEEKRRYAELRKRSDALAAQISEMEERMLSTLGTREGSAGLQRSLSVLEGSMKWIEDEMSRRVEEFRDSLEKRSTEILRSITGSEAIGISVHPETMSIGRVRSDDGEKNRTVPLPRLSAGERESVNLALAMGMTDLLKCNMIMDSPFTNMESKTVERSLMFISRNRKYILMTVPDGSIPDRMINNMSREDGHLSRIQLVEGTDGSRMREVTG